MRRYLRFCTPLSGMAVSPSSLLLQIRPQMSVLAECLIRQLITDEPSPVYFRDAVAFSSLALFEEHPDFHALLTGCIRSCTVRVKNIISADLSRPWMLGEGKRKLTAVCSHQTRIGNLDAHLTQTDI
ncbi:hypothetical protein ACNCWG_005445 [Escherichia coli]